MKKFSMILFVCSIALCIAGVFTDNAFILLPGAFIFCFLQEHFIPVPDFLAPGIVNFYIWCQVKLLLIGVYAITIFIVVACILFFMWTLVRNEHWEKMWDFVLLTFECTATLFAMRFLCKKLSAKESSTQIAL